MVGAFIPRERANKTHEGFPLSLLLNIYGHTTRGLISWCHSKVATRGESYEYTCIPNNGSILGCGSLWTGMFVLPLMPGLVPLTQQGTWGPLVLYLFTSVAPIAVNVGGRNIGLPVERCVTLDSRACVVPCLSGRISQWALITRQVFHRQGKSRAVQTKKGERTQNKNFWRRRDGYGIILPSIPVWTLFVICQKSGFVTHLLWVNSWRQQSRTVNGVGVTDSGIRMLGPPHPFPTRRFRAITWLYSMPFFLTQKMGTVMAPTS